MIVVAFTAEWQEFIAPGMMMKKEARWIKLRKMKRKEWREILRRVQVIEERLEFGKSEG
jgi:hypothetical protein